MALVDKGQQLDGPNLAAKVPVVGGVSQVVDQVGIRALAGVQGLVQEAAGGNHC